MILLIIMMPTTWYGELFINLSVAAALQQKSPVRGTLLMDVEDPWSWV